MLKWNGNVMRRVQAVAASVCAMVAALGAMATRVEGQTLPSANLVVNGAADNGMTGWRVYEGSVGVRALTAPGVSNGTVFWGNTSAIGRADQWITLPSQYHAAIDAGCIEIDFFVMLGGWTNQGDYAIARFEVFDAWGTRTSQTDLGPVTAAQRGNVTQLLARSARFALPAFSRLARVEFVSARAAGTNNDGYLDDLGVRLVGRSQSPPFASGSSLQLLARGDGELDFIPPAIDSRCSSGYWFHEGVLLSPGMQVGSASVLEASASRLRLSSCPGVPGQIFFAAVANAFGSNPFAPQRVESRRVVFPLGSMVFHEQPLSVCALPGQTVKLRARAAVSGTQASVRYQWFRSGAPWTSLNGSEVLQFVASENSAGVYRCLVMDPCGNVAWSNEATVEVRDLTFSASIQDVYESCGAGPVRPLVLQHDFPPGTAFRWEMHTPEGQRFDLRLDSGFIGAASSALSAIALAPEVLSSPLISGLFEAMTARWQGPEFVCYALVDGCDVAVARGRWIDSTSQPCQPFGASFGVQAGLGFLSSSSVTEAGFVDRTGPVNWRIEHHSTSGGGSTGTGFASATYQRVGSISHEEDDGEVIYVTFSTSGTAFVNADLPETPLVERGSASTPRLATPVVFVDRPVWAQYGFGGNPPSGPAERFVGVVPLKLASEYVASASTPQFTPGSPAVTDSFAASVNIRLTLTPPPGTCDPLDFNNDGLFPDDADLLDFLSVLAGGPCSVEGCSDIDFNNDGLFPDDTDLLAFLRVLAGGSCE